MARFMEKFAVCNVIIPYPDSVGRRHYAKLPRRTSSTACLGQAQATRHRRRPTRRPTPRSSAGRILDVDRPAADARRDAGVPRRHRDRQAGEADRPACSSGPSTPTTGRTSGPTCCGRTRTASASRRSSTSTPGSATPSGENMPYDQFVREIVTAQGSTFRNGAGGRLPRPPRAGRDRHDGQPALPRHPARLRQVPPPPVRVWSQDDFYSFAAYFARIGRKGHGHLAADLGRRGDHLHRPRRAR